MESHGLKAIGIQEHPLWMGIQGISYKHHLQSVSLGVLHGISDSKYANMNMNMNESV